MLTIVIIYLWASVSLYLVTGGADFGAGIVELITPKKHSRQVTDMLHKSTAPIWEANHMWLILAIVILFVAFPVHYAEISSALFIPLTIMLLGIVARGTSYAFRNGDTMKDELVVLDKIIYITSSIITPFFMGVIGASIFSGRIHIKNGDFLHSYVYNWLDVFPLSIGLLTVVVCAYLAAVYVLGNENYGKERLLIRPQAVFLTLAVPVAVVIAGLAANSEGQSLLAIVPKTPALIVIATIIILTAIVWILINRQKPKWVRLYAAVSVLIVQFALFDSFYTSLKSYWLSPENLPADGHSLKTIHDLAITLLIASVFILPSLGYLVYKFEWQERNKKKSRL